MSAALVDWRLDRTLHLLLGPVCLGVAQAGEGEDAAGSALAGKLTRADCTVGNSVLRVAMQIVQKNYDEVPWYWYGGLLILSFLAGT